MSYEPDNIYIPKTEEIDLSEYATKNLLTTSLGTKADRSNNSQNIDLNTINNAAYPPVATIPNDISVNNVNSIGNTLGIGNNNECQTVNIACNNNIQTLNLGTTSGQTTINIGGSGDTVNVAGTLNYIQSQDLQVNDKNIVLNKGSQGSGTARDAGISIRDNFNDNQAYILTSSLGTSFVLKAPESSNILSTPILTSSDTLVARNTTDTLNNKTLTGTTNIIRATQLGTTGSDVVINTSSQPSTGQVLTATSSTTASWATPSSSVGSSSNQQMLYNNSGVLTGTTNINTDGTNLNINTGELRVRNSRVNLAGGFNWTSRTTPVDNQWVSVCYGNGLFVAVSNSGTGNRVMTSPDGVVWTARNTSGFDNDWRSVCYGNGLFVAVLSTGTGNRVMTSPDGAIWTPRTTNNNNWGGVCYGNGLFVAVGYSGTGNRVMTSPDGINWTPRTSAADNNWISVCYGNGLFVAVATSGTGNRVMTSPDGVVWTPRTSAADNDWRGVCYGNGLFVAVSISGTGNRVMTSSNGIDWTPRTTNDNTWMNVCYGNGLFVAVSQSGTGNRVMTSPDGAIWTPRTTNDNNWISVCYGNGLFVAVSWTGNNNRVMTSGTTIETVVQNNNITQGNQIFRGNIGIQNNTPIYPLDVVGDINLTGNIRVGGNIQSYATLDGTQSLTNKTLNDTTNNIRANRLGTTLWNYDLNTTPPTHGQLLSYNSSNNTLVWTTPSSGGDVFLNQVQTLTNKTLDNTNNNIRANRLGTSGWNYDLNTTSATNGQVLSFNGTNIAWTTPTSGGDVFTTATQTLTNKTLGSGTVLQTPECGAFTNLGTTIQLPIANTILVGQGTIDTLVNKTINDASNLVYANGLRGNTWGYGINNTPSSGQVLSFDGNNFLNWISPITASSSTTFTNKILNDNTNDIRANRLGTSVWNFPLNNTTPSNNQVLTYNSASNDLRWTTPTSGGTPAGSNSQLQFNSNGSFGGASGLTTEGSNLFINSTVNGANQLFIGNTCGVGSSQLGSVVNNFMCSTNATVGFYRDFAQYTLGRFNNDLTPFSSSCSFNILIATGISAGLSHSSKRYSINVLYNQTSGNWLRVVPANAFGGDNSFNDNAELYVLISGSTIAFRMWRNKVSGGNPLNHYINITATGNVSLLNPTLLSTSGTDTLPPAQNILNLEFSQQGAMNVDFFGDIYSPMNLIPNGITRFTGHNYHYNYDKSISQSGDRWMLGSNIPGQTARTFGITPDGGTVMNMIWNPDGTTYVRDLVVDVTNVKPIGNCLFENSGSATNFNSTTGYNPITLYSSTALYGSAPLAFNASGWWSNVSGKSLKVSISVNATNNINWDFQMVISVGTVANVFNSNRVYGRTRSLDSLDGNKSLSFSCCFIMATNEYFSLYCRNTQTMNLNYNINVLVG